jgi:hypothetical protein
MFDNLTWLEPGDWVKLRDGFTREVISIYDGFVMVRTIKGDVWIPITEVESIINI